MLLASTKNMAFAELHPPVGADEGIRTPDFQIGNLTLFLAHFQYGYRALDPKTQRKDRNITFQFQPESTPPTEWEERALNDKNTEAS